jgi:hypothetical protein
MAGLDGEEALVSEILQHPAHVGADRLARRLELFGQRTDQLGDVSPSTQPLDDRHRGGAREQDALGRQQNPAVAYPVEMQPDPGRQRYPA